MPIKGLTDEPRLPQIGHLRKGAPKQKNRPGQDLDHFRFEADDEATLERFRDAYGERPRLINAFLPYETAQENFDAWFEEYVAGGLVRRCNGETIVLERAPDDAEFDDAEKPCKKGDGCNCKRTGRLHVIVPELSRIGVVVVHTTSFHDIRNMAGALARYEKDARRAGMTLDQIPFVLRRRPQKISTPGRRGRVRREKSLLVLEPAPQWVDRRLEQAHEQALQLGDGSAREGDLSHVPMIEGAAAPGSAEAEDVQEPSAIDVTPSTTTSTRRQLEGAMPTFIKEAQTAASDLGFTGEDRALRLSFTSRMVERELESFKDLTSDEAAFVTDAFDWLGQQDVDRPLAFAAWCIRQKADLTSPRCVQEALHMYRTHTAPSAPPAEDWQQEADEYFNTMPEDLQ